MQNKMMLLNNMNSFYYYFPEDVGRQERLNIGKVGKVVGL